jgi:hypothetical protein
MIKSKGSRQLLLYGAVALGIEFAIIYAICLLISGQDDPTFMYALIGLAGLYGFRVANGLMNMVVGTIVYYLTKKQRVSTVVAMFYQHKIPVNQETMFADGTGVLDTLAVAKELNEEAKKFAVMSVGELNGIRASSRPLALLQRVLSLTPRGIDIGAR